MSCTCRESERTFCELPEKLSLDSKPIHVILRACYDIVKYVSVCIMVERNSSGFEQFCLHAD